MQFAYCSAKDCNYIQKFGYVNPTDSIKPEKFCSECGSPMLIKCTNCEASIKKPDARFCSDCGKSYK